ncbi:hypothetical protein [Streptomyces beihaiensis]|uniref:Uncharacterized protein n=1 Tax=Streptomyces beihaiensis TaxID=2984495 RepID=A0ABT3TQ15_9ACTN|nr:hypothetical protein [Streptomyces beihaiensis]MCX3059087.1 hypothetical protein [Streptomyces beihaiensis]
MVDATVAARSDIADSVLGGLIDAFGLGDVRERLYLADGALRHSGTLVERTTDNASPPC